MKFSKLFFFLCIAAAYFNVGISQAQTRKQLEVAKKKNKTRNSKSKQVALCYSKER